MKNLSLALGALLAVGTVQAGTVSFQYGVPLAEATTEINQTGALGLFDSSLGILTGASLTIFGSATFAFTGTSTAAQPQNASLTANSNLFWSSSLGALTPFLDDVISLSLSSGFQSYTQGQTRTFGPVTRTGQFTDDLSSILASLQAPGGGAFNLRCESLSGFLTEGGGGNISNTQNTTAGCGAIITYTFDDRGTPPVNVPEPGSLALVGLALAGVGFASRRRRQA